VVKRAHTVFKRCFENLLQNIFAYAGLGFSGSGNMPMTLPDPADERPLIAIFCNSFPPESGGASARIYNLAVLLRDAGYRVQVICALPNYPTGRIFPGYRGKRICDGEVDGIPVKRVWMLPSNSASAIKRGASIMSFVLSLRLQAYREVRRARPALVIVSSPPLPMAADAVRYFSGHGVKVLLNVSDIWPLSASALGALQDSPLYRILQQRERAMYSHADAFTAQSEETLRHLGLREPSAKPAMLYRNLPAVAAGEAQAEAARPNRIIYPGMLGHAQGVLAICQAIDFAALNVSLDIYGEGAELPAIEAWIAKNKGCPVRLHKPISPAELTRILPGFHAMLVPLIAPIEGALPSKLFTAVQEGLPVLFSGGGEGAALVNAHSLGWVARPGDYTMLSKNISDLSQLSAGAYAAMRRHIALVGRTIFNKSVQDAQLLRFISELPQTG
jgi:glycosyltransferase involved in cell wall biosynthesis